MATRNVKRWDLEVDKGLGTNLSPDTMATKYLTDCANMDGYDQFRGLGKMPGSGRIAAAPNPGVSVCGGLFYYEGYSRANEFNRDVLAVYDGLVYQVNDGAGTLTALTMPGDSSLGLDTGAGSTNARAVQAWGRLFLTAPDATDLRTGMIAWDGEALEEVGTLAPGQFITLFTGAATVGNWSVTNGTIAASTVVQIGSSSISMAKTSTTDVQVRMDLASVNYDFTAAGGGKVYVYVYFPSTMFDKLDEQIAVEVLYGEASFTAYNAHWYPRGTFNVGWNRLEIDTASPSGTYNGGATLANVNIVRLDIRTKNVTDTFTGVLWNYLHYTDVPAATLVQGYPAEGLNDTGSWSAGANTTVALNTSLPHHDGLGCIQMQKTGTGAATAYMDNTDGFNWSAVGNHVYVWLYLDGATYATLPAAGTALQIAYGDNGLANYGAETRTKAALRTGWQLIDINLASPDTVGGGGATLATIVRVRFQLNTTNAADIFYSSFWDFMHTRGAGIEHFQGNINTTVSYVTTFVNRRGVESNAGEASNSLAITSGVAVLYNVPVSSQSSVVERRIYRDNGGDGLYRYVGSILDNQETNFVDNLAGASLATTQPPFAGDSTFDNSPPGRLYDAISYNGRIIGIDAQFRNVLRMSDINVPDVFRLIDSLTGEEPFTCIRQHALGPLVYSSDATYLLLGDGINTPYYLERVSNSVGANSWRSVVETKGSHFVQHERKAYLIQNPRDPWYISGPVQDLFDDFELMGEADTAVLHDFARTRILFVGENTADDVVCYQWQYGTRAEQAITGEGPGVDPQDVRNGSWEEIRPSSSIFRDVAMSQGHWCAVERESVAELGDQSEVWYASPNGVYAINRKGVVNDYVSGFSGSATALNGTVTFASVPVGRDIGGRGSPRYLQVDAYAASATTWTATVEFLTGPDGASLGTLERAVLLPQGHSSVVVPIGSYISNDPSGAGNRRASWVRLTLSHNGTNGYGQFKGPVRLFYTPRSAGHGIRSA